MGARLEKFRKGANDKRFYFLWLMPVSAFIYFLWRKILRGFDPKASLFDIGMFETPMVSFMLNVFFVMATILILSFSFRHQMEFYLQRMRETFSSLTPIHKCAVWLFVFFNLYWGFIILAGKLMN